MKSIKVGRSYSLYAMLLLFLLASSTASAQIIINEIMFDPAPIDEESGAEYIELLNTGDQAIAVGGWKIFDRSERAQATIPSATRPIPAGGYLLVASDSTIYTRFPALLDASNVVTIGKASFSLNLEDDEVRIRDAKGKTVDSVGYSSDWHWSALAGTRGVSLERISSSGSSTDRRNWSSAVTPLGGTPGVRNSRALDPRREQATLSARPDILSPDADGRDDFTRISWRIPREAALVTITLHDRHGRPIVRIVESEPTPAEGETIWNGLDDRSDPVPPGIYLLLLEAFDGTGNEVIVAKGKVVVGG